MPMRPPRHTVGPALAAVLVVLLAKGVAAEPKYVGWPKVEASRDLREIKEKLRESGQFDDVATRSSPKRCCRRSNWRRIDS